MPGGADPDAADVSQTDVRAGPALNAPVRRGARVRAGKTWTESTNELGAFLVPLDRNRLWYRYHPVLRSRLKHELVATEPELVPVLHQRAAEWYQEAGDSASALVHAHAAGDAGRRMAAFTSQPSPR